MRDILFPPLGTTWVDDGATLTTPRSVVIGTTLLEPGQNLSLPVTPPGSLLYTGDGQTYFSVPSSMNGMSLVAVGAVVGTASSSGTPTFQVRKKKISDDSIVDMLTTPITIDANERSSATAATAAVISTVAATKTVATDDIVYIDVDVAGTGTAGAIVRLLFR